MEAAKRVTAPESLVILFLRQPCLSRNRAPLNPGDRFDSHESLCTLHRLSVVRWFCRGWSESRTLVLRRSSKQASAVLHGRALPRNADSDVEERGAIAWVDGQAPDGRVSCSSGGQSNKVVGRFRTASGTNYQLGFEPPGRNGDVRDGYRLAFVRVLLPAASRLQVDEAFKTLTARYAPMFLLPNGPAITETPDAEFDVSFDKELSVVSGETGPGSIMMIAHYKNREKWLSSLPECKASRPQV